MNKHKEETNERLISESYSLYFEKEMGNKLSVIIMVNTFHNLWSDIVFISDASMHFYPLY